MNDQGVTAFFAVVGGLVLLGCLAGLALVGWWLG